MSDRLRVTGMYSGMDTETIVSELVKAKQVKVTNLKNEQKKLEWKQTAWQDLNSKIYSLYSNTLSSLRLKGTYQKKNTKCSDTTKATIVSGSNAVDGTQTLKISQIAKAGYLTGAELTSSSGGKIEASDKMANIDPSLIGKKINVKVGSGGDAKTSTIEITDDMSVSDFTSRLSEAGLSANFDVTNQRFFISSKNTGFENEFELSSDDGEDVLKSLGIAERMEGVTRIYAQDATIKLNGAEFTGSSNTFEINGLTITALAETGDSELSITTTTDYDGIYDTIKNFLTEYNDLINEMDKLYNADSARKYDMLTDDEKEAMSDDEVEQWEDKIKGALLRKDTSLSSVMNSMINIMMGSYQTGSLSDAQKEQMSASEIAAWNKEHTKSLWDYGISTLSYFEAEDNEHHAYHIDGDSEDEATAEKADKLKKAIVDDPEGTANFFANLCKKMYDSLYEQMGRTDYSSVYKVYNDKKMKSDYDDYTKKIKEAEKALSAYEDKWYDKFTAMEKAMAKMQSAQNSVSSMLNF